jgi:hypothetical protein
MLFLEEKTTGITSSSIDSGLHLQQLMKKTTINPPEKFSSEEKVSQTGHRNIKKATSQFPISMSSPSLKHKSKSHKVNTIVLENFDEGNSKDNEEDTDEIFISDSKSIQKKPTQSHKYETNVLLHIFLHVFDESTFSHW